ncbi:gamma-glutamyl-gamma-aminobutyrate hydrolase family protein [Rhizobium helianthi]|uniref:Gamma-glutamyl-gamma-aminobutyrate hydrolase family protein n=1 Tax=Rhizobium helianthi TaxID=1132695 RepID=A0ABW4M9Z5_9HYPH
MKRDHKSKIGPPVVGVMTDRRSVDDVAEDCVRVRYLEALSQSAGVAPLLLPTDCTDEYVAAYMARLDGLLLTGAASNVDPRLYGGSSAPPETLDPHRDRTVMAAIKAAISVGLPVLGICRGLQELNVALGGTLCPEISNGPHRLVHTENLSLARDDQYRPVHKIQAEGNGVIAQCLRACAVDGHVLVNSLHGQGIGQLADTLAVDAYSTDGVIEAVSLPAAAGFVAAVQWHPEWFHNEDGVSSSIFRRFGAACRSYQQGKMIAS